MLLPGLALAASASPVAPTTPLPMPNGWLARYLLDPAGFTSKLAHHVLGGLAHVARVAGPPLAAAVVVFVAGRLVLARWRGVRQRRGARFVAILPPPEVDAAGAESLWRTLAGQLRPGWRGLLRGRPHVSFELDWSASGVRFGVWLPASVAAFRVEHAIQAAWPGAATTTDPARAPLPSGTTMLGGELRLADREWFPLRADLPTDPYRMLLGAAAGLGTDDSAVVQVLARPAPGRRLRRCRRAARSLRTGVPMTAAGKLLDLVQPGPAARPPRLSEDPWRSADLRAIQTKAAEGGWEVVVRYGLSGRGTGRRERRRLATHARALTAAFALFDGRNQLAPHRMRNPGGTLAARSMRCGDLMSVPELASLAHLPLDVGVPGLVRAGARAVPPPAVVPTTGKILGDTEAGPRRTVALSPADARHHLHVLGATGSGKSTLLTNLVLGDVAAGRGAVVIDPKGDLVNDILDRVPASVVGRVVLIDPEEAEAPPSLNVLEGPDAALAVEHLVGIFRRIFEAYWGPRTDDVLRMACLTVLRRPSASLADVPRLLTDARFRAACLAEVDDEFVGSFWAWYDALTPAGQAQVVGPVMNKLRVVLTRPFMADVVGSARSSFDMAADVLDGGLLLVRVPKGILGDETARLLGSFVVARVWQAITARSRAGEAARCDASPYVDECHNFLTLPRSLEDMLAEARGYRLSVVCAHQHLGQLPRELREAVLGQRPQQGLLLPLARGRPSPPAPRAARARRARPLPSRRLPGGGEARRERRGASCLHASHPPGPVGDPRPGRRCSGIGAGEVRAQPQSAPRRGAPAEAGWAQGPRRLPRRIGRRPLRCLARHLRDAGVGVGEAARQPLHHPGGWGGRLTDQSVMSADPVRPRRSGDLVAAVARRMTPRDRLLCHVLWDHRVLTTAQIADLCFDSIITAQHRLVTLYRLRVLDRFRHFRPTGSDPYHYTLDELGAALVAADRGIEAPKRSRLRARGLALASSQRLRHLLGVNGFFCALARAARSAPDAGLEEWWSEQRCATEWGEVVRPDGFGVWRQGRSRVEFFLEHDGGTETLSRLTAKLDGYRDLAGATGWRPWVLLWFPSAGREAEARRALGPPEIPVATAAAALGGPGEAVWLPLGDEAGRRRLGRLTAAPASRVP